MKRFIALMCVCASLAAMAGVPRVNPGLPMYMPAMDRAPKSVKPATLGVSGSQMTGNRIVFLHQYECVDGANGAFQAVPCDPTNVGGWLTAVTNGSGVVTLQDGILYEIEETLEANLSAGKVTLVANNEPFTSVTSTETTTTAGNVITVETTVNYYYVNEAWMLNQGPLANVIGNINNDGSIVFNEGFGYYIETITTTTIKSKGETTVTTDTARQVSPLLRDVKLMKPNGKHEFVNEYDNTSRSVDVYMYQDGDNVYVMNLYGYGWGENYMVLNSDGTMNYPGQPLRDIKDAENPAGDGVWYNMTYSGGNATLGNTGNVTTTAITWGLTVPGDNNSLWYGWLNNRLYYTDGTTFVIPGDVTVLRGDVNDDKDVTIADVSALIDYLLTGDASLINTANADTNLDTEITIADVSALIDYLLTGEWTD